MTNAELGSTTGRRSWLRGRALGIDIMAVIASSAATGVLGFVFWTVAARGYSTAEVGRASAIITSAATTATLATLSLGSLYERFLPVAGRDSRRYVRSGIAVVVTTAMLFGAVFLVLGPREQLFPDALEMLLFPGFVGILALFALQDQILIGLGRTRVILTKNVSQSVIKLIAVAALIPLATGSAIVWSWMLPAAVIAIVVGLRVITPVSRRHDGDPDLPPRSSLFQFFASSCAINAVLVVVPLVVPLIIVSRLGTEMNAYFSMCWLLVSTLGVLLGATAAPFIATASAPGADLRACTLRFTVMCSAAGILGSAGLFVAGPTVLSIMGPEYAEEGGRLIRLMALTLPMLAVLSIYTAMARLRRRLRLAVTVQLFGAILIICGVAYTTPIWGIDAVGYAYLSAELISVAIVAVPTFRHVRRALRSSTPTEPADDSTATTPQYTDSPLQFDSVAAQFAAVVQDQPDRIAVRTAADAITYRDLSAAARFWAARMSTANDNQVVLLSAGLSPATVGAVLGTFSSTTVLVALDPGLPVPRVQNIVEILTRNGRCADLLLTDDPHGDLAAALAPTCRVETTVTDTVGGDIDAPPPTAGRDDVTSIQFTSGSSGVPKAVLHGNGMWLCDAQLMSTRFGIRPGRRVALCMPISFGAGLNVLIGSLLNGAEVIAIDSRREHARAAFERIGESGAEIMVATPAFLEALATAAHGDQLPSLSRVVTTGEAAYARHVECSRGLAPRAVFTNWVGSSEVSSIATYDVDPIAELPDGAIPAGTASPHKRIDVDDTGAVTVSSSYLALGYLEPEASSSRFLCNADGTRSFIGGDVGRLDSDGNLILLGRADTAVKVRGYLVEPAEIEAVLLSYSEVREAVVMLSPRLGAAEAADPRLAAYLVARPDARTPSIAEIRTRLHRDLPAWMVPADLMILSELPRTERGKVDRQALPVPTRAVSEPPRGGLETAIAEIWCEVLQLAEVGRTESFYALGGDSLAVTDMLSRVGDTHSVRLSHADLASAPTLAQFTTTVTDRTSAQLPEHRRTLAPTTVPLRPLDADRRDGPVLFCFTGAGASALSFVPLADRIDPATAVYAFIPHGLENRGLPDWSVARAARRHLTDLRRLQPSGPYRLVGHSLGCYIALDIARQLEREGETVELVTLLDPFMPPAVVRAARRENPALAARAAAPAAEHLQSRRELWRRRILIPTAGLVQYNGQRQAQALEEVGVRVGRLHRPQPWSGRALLLLSCLNPANPALWNRLLTGDLRTETLSCDHNSILREPYASAVAGFMADYDAGRAHEDVSNRMSPTTP
ncbi:alpha/beta fold hydrolase [Mycolicibacterium sp.]|uniref:lipopolysaccharide biosynthesis protein n=1 Tax=Mycolicibacterium sp. TaxID=2320850 RepID=UPI0035605DE8